MSEETETPVEESAPVTDEAPIQETLQPDPKQEEALTEPVVPVEPAAVEIPVPVIAEPSPNVLEKVWQEFLVWEAKWLSDFKQHNFSVMRDELKQAFKKHL